MVSASGKKHFFDMHVQQAQDEVPSDSSESSEA